MTPSCLRVPPDRQSSLARAAGAAAGRGEARIQVRPRPRSVPGAAGRRRGAQGGFATLTSHRRAFKSCGAFGGRDLLSHASRSLQLGEIGPSCRANSMSRRDVNSCRFPIQPTIVRRRDRLLGFSLGCWPVNIATTVAIRRVGMGSRPRSRRDSFQTGTSRRFASAACGIPEVCRCCLIR